VTWAFTEHGWAAAMEPMSREELADLVEIVRRVAAPHRPQ
jgi:hypothetical protein